MESLGLTHEGFREYRDTLAGSHEVRFDVTLMDLDHRIVGQIRMIDGSGQVQGDRDGFGEDHGPQRRLTLTALDPQNRLGVGSGELDDSQVYYDRIMQVSYGVLCPTLGWVDLNVFTGLPWKLQNTDGALYVEADDLSRLGMESTWKPLTIEKGTLLTTAIRRILARAGFTHVRLPVSKKRLAHAVSLGRHHLLWAVADRLASTQDWQLYVDGSGIPTARRLPGNTMFTFDSEIVEPVAGSTDRSRFVDAVEVIGRKPKGAKRRVGYVAKARASDDLSSESLAHNGEPFYAVETIENDHFRTTAQCRRKAERVLADRLRARESVTCGVLPQPHLTPGDMGRFVGPLGDWSRDRIDAFTLPLGTDEPMRLNWLDKDTTDVTRVRR